MSLHLTVAGSLEPLVDVLAEELSRPLADPFAAELVVVPSDGIGTWLDAQLSRRLGATAGLHNGIVANLRHVFPASIVGRALGEHDRDHLSAWGTGPLTWAVHDILRDRGAEFDQSAELSRARTIADLFDRYSLHRSTMVRRWSGDHVDDAWSTGAGSAGVSASTGVDVDAFGAALDPLQLWQPQLWRAVQQQLDAPTDAQRLAACVEAIRSGALDLRVERDFPERIFVFGLASLPSSHLSVLTAVSTQLEVHVLAPVPSPQRWGTVRSRLTLPLRPPEPRSDETLPAVAGHPLVTGWGRAIRESHVLLLDAAASVPSHITGLDAPSPSPESTESPTLLQQLQHDIRADRPLVTDLTGLTPDPVAAHFSDPRPTFSDPRPTFVDPRPTVAEHDRSLQWHRAHGAARQVEILRDALLHLLDDPAIAADGSEPINPRDIAVLCTDVGRFAPLIEATFAGDPEHGVPAIPVRVADRTLRADSALTDAVGAILDLLDGRFRLSQVLDFASRPPVQLQFGLDPSSLATLETWAVATNVHWGLDADDHAAFGLPADPPVHTWAAGLDQLLLGSVMADAGPRLVLDSVVPFPDVEGAGVAVAGAFAELLRVLQRTTSALRQPATVVAWSAHLLEAVHALCAVPDDDMWRWHSVDSAITTFADEACLHGHPRDTVHDPAELAALLRSRLDAGGGRPRFGTGVVTVSALTAQRGIPHRVICLLGLDDDLGSASVAATDDLLAAQPCIGDRDARSEHRAQLLDALLAATDRLLLFSTGRDIRTNAPLAPPVAVAELLEVIDATMRAPDGARVSSHLTFDHPRQAWSDLAFVPGMLGAPGPWSYDRGARTAALARRSEVEPVSFFDAPLPDAVDVERVPLTRVLIAAREPVQVLLRERLGLSLTEHESTIDDQIPLALDAITQWAIADELLQARLALGPAEPADPQWRRRERARGSVPPGSFGDDILDTVGGRVDGLLAALVGLLDHRPYAPRTVAVRVDAITEHGPRVLEGNITGVCDDLIVAVSPSRLADHTILSALLRVAALTLHDPGRRYEAITIGRPRESKSEAIAWQRVALLDPASAGEVLGVFVDLARRSLADAVPAFPAVTRALFLDDRKSASAAWSSTTGDSRRIGERHSRFTSFIPEFQCDFADLLLLPARPDEAWAGAGAPRLAQWAERLWGTVARHAEVVETNAPAAGTDGSDGSTDDGDGA